MNKRILVIEDNEQNMYLVRFMLEANGYEVLEANTGSDGINSAIEYHPDLVLLDIQLPTMDGYAVAREMRKHQDIANTPIVAVTSYAMPGDRENVLAAGCTGYIEKPINPDTFITQVKKFFK